MKNLLLNNYLVIVLIFSLFKITNAQIVISRPQLGFTQACGSDNFNEFNINFTLSQENNLNADNQFSIELSDAMGDFSNSQIITPNVPPQITGSFVRMQFGLPRETSGDQYRIRVISSSPVARSSSSISFPAYFRIQDSQFTINNLEQTAEYCRGGGFVLTIDNPGRNDNISPLQFPSLSYNWFREVSPTEAELVATTVSFEVTEPGTYFVETNYGSCPSNSFSNRVTVTESSSTDISSIISSSLGNPYCINDGPTTLRASASGNAYQWFLNNELIPGATEQEYITNEQGNYTVNIDIGICSATADIDLINSFTSSINISETNFIETDETLEVVVTTNAIDPVFTWFFNDNIIADEISNTLNVSDAGNYRIVISQSGDCVVTEEFTFEITKPVVLFPDVTNIPNIITPNNDGVNDTWIIPQEFVNGTNTNVVIINSTGKIVLETSNYQNNWPNESIDLKTNSPVFFYIITLENNETRKGSITVIN